MKGNGTPQELKEYTAKYRRRRKWLTVVTCLAAVVVFCTVYALILPAAALEKNSPKCGKEEHSHSEVCYTQTLVCGQEENSEHTHDSECYGESELICGMEEHTHDDSCYEDSDGGGQQSDSGADDGIAPVAESRDAVLTELAGQGIYPGTADSTGVWTVYDTGNEETANIKATVTLPTGTTVAEDHYLYIRPVGAQEDYYPEEDTLKAAVGDAGTYSDVQCYAIHWVHIYEEEGVWKYSLATDSVLGGANGNDDSAPSATVKIEYHKSDAYLGGPAAHRKLIVFNSRNSDGTDLEDASTPTEVTANSDAYTGFTFETNRGGPYVFVSKYLYDGYVSSVTANIQDGLGPFDKDDDAGNDSGNSNSIVRSYDAINYNLTINLAARSNSATEKEGKLWMEATLDADITEAIFHAEKFGWMDDYTIEYLDAEGNTILTQKKNGTCVTEDGSETTLNDFIARSALSSDQESESYTTAVVSQRLLGYVTEIADGDSLLTGNKEHTAGVQVLGADNGDIIQPTFRVWFDGNEDNYGSESAGQGTGVTLAQKVTANLLETKEIKVSAAARFNLELAENANVSYKSWFDSSQGNEVSRCTYTVGGKTISGADMCALLEALAELEENQDKSEPEEFTDAKGSCADALDGLSLNDYKDVFKNIRYGRITGYGITLQVYNQTTGDDAVSSKGFRGVSLPKGDVTFDMALKTLVTPMGSETSDENTNYYALLWEYNENENSDKGNQSHNMYWDNLASTQYAAWAAPYNSGTGTSYCYNGGKWELSQKDGYSFKVSGYDFNLNASGVTFPTHKAGNSTATEGYNSYIGSFSAGYVQVLNVIPRNQSQTLKVDTSVQVNNLTLTTKGGQEFTPNSEDDTKYEHESNTGDNLLNDMIPLYAKGGATKGNAFCNSSYYEAVKAGRKPGFTDANYFLGTDYWTTGYDASAFAGQKITLVGAARINAGDYLIKHMNILQLFDTKVLSLDPGSGDPMAQTGVSRSDVGEVTILYAADPDHPEGYDSNADGMQAYMSKVREEDLIYYTSLEELEEDNYTCVGVLAELRNCTIYGEGGYSTTLNIPMKVSEEKECLNQTVSTVNTVRIWTDSDDMKQGTVTWADGEYDETTEKNSVDGYTPVNNSKDDYYEEGSYSPAVENSSAYIKTEYANGQVILGASNTGGYVYGATLLVLGYKSEVDIQVDKDSDEATPSYNMDRGEYTVNYHLRGIRASVDNMAGTPQTQRTNLTIHTEMDTAWEGEAQRILISSDSYNMVAASEAMKLVDDNGNELESVEISSDSQNPTTVHYRLLEDPDETDPAKQKWIDYEITVYAQRNTDGGKVTFELKNVTVGVNVPDITFDAVIQPDAVENANSIQVTASISGTDDIRAYAITNGNMDSTVISVIKQGGTQLVKSVSTNYIELDGLIQYTITYSNTGADPVDVYLYDLLPEDEDYRGSHTEKAESNLILREITAELTQNGVAAEDFDAQIQFYYSKTPYTALYELVSPFGDPNRGQEGAVTNAEAVSAIENLLSDTRYFNPLGTITADDGHELQPDSDLPTDATELTGLMTGVSGIYAVIDGLDGGHSISFTLTVETDDNTAGDLYKNTASTWLGNDTTPLTSNLVETTVLSRAISGVVWDDADFDGVRDEGENLIPGVECTLFKLDEDEDSSTYGEYILCEKDVTGARITSVTTDENGAYSFEKLAAGDYIVAFSGNALEGTGEHRYVGATTYQVNKTNDSTTNDAVALSGTKGKLDTDNIEIVGIDDAKYRYAIAYSFDSEKKTVGAAPLHTIEEILEGNISLTNGVELHANLDCGLVIASYELPKTGGAGTTLYTIGGLLIISISLLLLYRKKYQDLKF